jgi:hypothetical protein
MEDHMMKFNETERFILLKKYSRQRIDYWEARGYVPAHLLFAVSELIGRKVEDLLTGRRAATSP